MFNWQRKYGGLIIILLLIILPNVALIFVKLMEGNLFGFIRAWYSACVSLGIILLIPVFFNANLKKFFYALIPLYLLISPVLFIVILYHRVPTRWMLSVLLNAEVSEVQEFSSESILWKLLVIIIPLIIIFTTNRLSVEKLNFERRSKIIFGSLLFVLIFSAFGFKTFQKQTIKISSKCMFRAMFKDTPVYTFNRLYKAANLKKKSEQADKPSPGKINSVSTNSKDLKELYVLVIGESSRYSNWGINGYERETTPNLKSMNRLVSFSEAISPSCLTQECLPLMLTAACASDTGSKTACPSVFSVFKEANFKTWWISNQRFSGSRTAGIVSCADKTVTLYPENSENELYDARLIDVFKEVLKDTTSKKKMVALQLKGSHYPYHKRYPEEFTRFKPVIRKNKHISYSKRKKEEIINSYDNSILYTDYVVSSLIRLMEKDSTYGALCFVSDHGDNLFDDNTQGSMRGHPKASPNLYRIPFLIWTTPDYYANNQGLCCRMKEKTDVKFSSDKLIYVLSSMANITWSGYKEEKNILSGSFVEHPRYIIANNNKLLYEELFN